MVASDRVSVFDVVLPDEIPDKGRVLTGVSQYWFDQTADIVRQPRHLERPDRLSRDGRRRRRPRDARARDAARSAWSVSYAATSSGTAGRSTPSGARSVAFTVPDGLQQAERLPEPLFTPTTKAESGHDLPLTASEAAEFVGADIYEQLRDLSIRIYALGGARATRTVSCSPTRSSSSASSTTRCMVIDEMMTPDSSRYWPLDGYQVGHRRRRRSTSSSCATSWTAPDGITRRPRRACRRT